MVWLCRGSCGLRLCDFGAFDLWGVGSTGFGQGSVTWKILKGFSSLVLDLLGFCFQPLLWFWGFLSWFVLL